MFGSATEKERTRKKGRKERREGGKEGRRRVGGKERASQKAKAKTLAVFLNCHSLPSSFHLPDSELDIVLPHLSLASAQELTRLNFSQNGRSP